MVHCAPMMSSDPGRSTSSRVERHPWRRGSWSWAVASPARPRRSSWRGAAPGRCRWTSPSSATGTSSSSPRCWPRPRPGRSRRGTSSHPIRPLCTAAGIEFGEMRVEAIDLARRRATARHSRSRARGSSLRPGSRGPGGAERGHGAGAVEHALTFKGAGDAVQIRNRVIDLFEAAALMDDPWVQRRLLTFVVVGRVTGHRAHGGRRGAGAGDSSSVTTPPFPLTPSARSWSGARSFRRWPPTSRRMPRSGSSREPLSWSHPGRQGLAEGLELQDGRAIPSHCVIWMAGNR